MTAPIQPASQKPSAVESQRFLDLLRKRANDLQTTLDAVSAEITAIEEAVAVNSALIVENGAKSDVHIADETIHFVDRFADKSVPTGELVGDSDYQTLTNKIITEPLIGTEEQVRLGNYSTFEADGTYKMLGESSVWDDAQIVLGSVRLPASSAPTWTAYKGGYVLSFDHASDNIIYFTCQLSHKYQLMSAIEFHIHVAYPNSNTGTSLWNFTYSWAKIGEDFPTETTVSVSLSSPGDADKHTIHEIIETITPSSAQAGGVSSILICSLERESIAGAGTYGSAIYLVAADFHIKCDTIGSRLEAVK
jgi:hypothetical protein